MLCTLRHKQCPLRHENDHPGTYRERSRRQAGVTRRALGGCTSKVRPRPEIRKFRLKRTTTVREEEMSESAYLVETEWLADNIESPNLRVFDCTVHAILNPDPDSKYPFVFESGRARFDQEHIHGAGFFDLIEQLSDPTSTLPFTVPSEQRFAEAMGAAGAGDGSQVVLYGTTEPIWAARVWWMLRAFGFESVSILNGGWSKWTQEGRPVSDEACVYEPRQFAAATVPDAFVGKEAVLASIGDEGVRTINALPAPVFSGTGGPVFGRKGRVAGSVNVPFASLHDPDTGAYLPIERLREQFEAVGVAEAERTITYCGSGVAASNDAFVLTMLGYENVSVYDASMSEWGHDDELPMDSD